MGLLVRFTCCYTFNCEQGSQRPVFFFSLPHSTELRTEFRTLLFLALFVELYFLVTFIFEENSRNG